MRSAWVGSAKSPGYGYFCRRVSRWSSTIGSDPNMHVVYAGIQIRLQIYNVLCESTLYYSYMYLRKTLLSSYNISVLLAVLDGAVTQVFSVSSLDPSSHRTQSLPGQSH